MEWIDVKDRMPEKEGKILILVGESIFCINVRIPEPGSCYLNLEKIYCEIVKTYEFESDIPLSIGIGKSLQMTMEYKTTFFKPSHYKDVTHWCEVPELPKETEN